MSVFKKKFCSVLLALSVIGTMSTFTVYADELDGTVTDGDYVVDDSNTGDYTPPADTPVVDTPVVDDVPADDTGDYSDNTTTDTPDVSYDDSSDDAYNDTYEDPNSGVQDNVVTDDYISEPDYSTGYEDTYTDSGYVEYYEPEYSYSEDYGMSFDEFERATDYSSAMVDTESPTVDMYNSNGSDTDTLSSDDWNDIKLNLGEASADGTGDFSFIKDNTSDENSNKSILFLIFGVVFLLSAVSIIIYLIATAIRSKKLEKAGAYGSNYNTGRSSRKTTSRKPDPHATKRTKFNYDTAEIDITKFDNYNDNY